jgi:predicted GH43/DUF377 family glycosyl hydrolase
MFAVKRNEGNPLLSPQPDHPWEAAAAFNWCPAMKGNTLHVVYRAMSRPELMDQTHIQMSVIGQASSTDGIHFTDRRALITPEYDWEKYGCEDPRVTKFGSNYYIFYTALGTYPFRAEGIKIAVAKTKDFKKIGEKHLVTPFNAKAMALFPEKVNGKMAALLTVHTDMPPAQIAYVEFEREEDIWSKAFWDDWHKNLDAHQLEVRRIPADQVELGSPPLLTEFGWLVIYSHIQNYFSGQPVFGIEALLLDKNNPRKIVGRTAGPMMVPEVQYEKLGNVYNIAFPTGALISGKNLVIFYGAADTYSCTAAVSLENLLETMTAPGGGRRVTRFAGNPIIIPRAGVKWEEKGTFNPAAILLEGKVHLLYRAVSGDNISTIGYAASRDGFEIDERTSEPIYEPREAFEVKGCEDPRIVEIGDVLYMTYTGYDGLTPRVVVSSISKADFLVKRWNWTKPYSITPPNVPDKDAAIFPEKISGKYLMIHRVHDSVCADFVNSLDFSKEKITECVEILWPRWGMWDEEKVGIAAPPIKTPKGWLMLYHGVSDRTIYRVGAVLLNKENPTEILSRSATPLLEPSKEYERIGRVPNVVFPCGAVVRGETLFIYYGAADSAVAVATAPLSAILKSLA